MNFDTGIQIKLILYLLIIGIIFPALKAFTGLPVFYPSLVLLIIFTLLRYPQIYLKTPLVWIYAFSGVLIAHSANETYNPNFHLNIELFKRTLTFLVPALIIELLIIKKDTKLSGNLGFLALVIVIISAILEILAEKRFPSITRIFTRNPDMYPWWVVAYQFGYVYSLPFIIGTLVSIHWKGISLHVSIILLLFYSVIISGFFTALFFSIIMFVLGLLLRLGLKNRFLVFGILIISLTAFSLKYEITGIMKKVPNSYIQAKIVGIEGMLMYGSGNNETEARVGSYEKSFKMFLQHPVWGVRDAKFVGGHSFWLDRLGNYGIIGTIPYIIIILSLSGRAKLLVPEDYKELYQIVLIMLFFLLFLNPLGSYDIWIIIYVLIPCILTYYTSKLSPDH
jgi:hypothetical protein